MTYSIVIAPLLWALFVYFVLMTIVNAISGVTSKTKPYAIISSVLVFLIIISDEIYSTFAHLLP